MDATLICDSCALASQAVGKSPMGLGIAAFCLMGALLVWLLPALYSWIMGRDAE